MPPIEPLTLVWSPGHLKFCINIILYGLLVPVMGTLVIIASIFQLSYKQYNLRIKRNTKIYTGIITQSVVFL